MSQVELQTLPSPFLKHGSLAVTLPTITLNVVNRMHLAKNCLGLDPFMWLNIVIGFAPFPLNNSSFRKEQTEKEKKNRQDHIIQKGSH